MRSEIIYKKDDMNIHSSKKDYNELPPLNKLFWVLWKEKKGYAMSKECSMGELLELAAVLYPMDLKHDYPAERTTFNNSIEYKEFFLGFDGKEPIETMWFEVNQKLKRRITSYIQVYGKS